MKILLLAPQPFYQHRGTPIAVRLLAEVLGGAGHEVDLLVFHEGEDVTLPNVSLHRIPAMPGLTDVPPGFSWKKICCDLLFWGKSLQLHRKKRYDIVHAVEEAVFLARLNRFFFRVPYVYDMDSCLSDQLLAKLRWLEPLRGLFENLEKKTLLKSVGVVAVCRALEEKVRKDAPHTVMVRLEDISLLGENREAVGNIVRLQDKLNIQGKIVLYVGNLERYQGIDLLIEGFALLGEQESDSTLVVIGGSAQDIAAYTDLCRQKELRGRVFFLGPRPVEQLGGYLQQADILVSPRIEGDNTPMKIYSYLDSGKPVLATRIASHTQVLDDHIAVLAEPDPRSLADGLRDLLENEEKAAALGAAARQRIAEKYSRPVFEKKLLDFYREMAAQIGPKD